MKLINNSIDSEEMKQIVSKYNLKKSISTFTRKTPIVYSSLDDVIEIKADNLGLIKLVFLSGSQYINSQNDIHLFKGSTIKSSRADVHTILGKPTISADKGYWDRFDYSEYCIHFQYGNSGADIGMVTIMSPDVAP